MLKTSARRFGFGASKSWKRRGPCDSGDKTKVGWLVIWYLSPSGLSRLGLSCTVSCLVRFKLALEGMKDLL